MFKIEIRSKKSIYEQIVDGIKSEIIQGNFLPGEKLPSVRDLSSRLTVNPNTIQKAYRALESDGWIYTASGLGCFVSEEGRPVSDKQLADLYGQLNEIITQLRFLGESEETIKTKIGGSSND